MSQRPFRFIHAADLHLDEPTDGLAEVPPHLNELLIDCPVLAAKRVFDAAVQYGVDFVVLSGDVVNVHDASPREMAFLVEQFQRLAQRNIAVYWAGAAIDSGDWPGHYPLPATVKQASRLHVQRQRHEIEGTAVCELVGRSYDRGQPPRPTDFANARDDLFSIAVFPAEFSGGLGDIGIRYWALGGSHRRNTPLQSHQSIAHDPGTPQGRSPAESGPHGCTLVEVDEQQQVRLTHISTDTLRFEAPKIVLGLGADRAELDRVLRDHTERMLADAGGPSLIVEWTIDCQGALFAELRHGKLAAELVEALNRDFAHKGGGLWSASLKPRLDGELPPAWLREDTLRGDYLRVIANLLEGSALSESAAIDEIAKLAEGKQAAGIAAQFDGLWPPPGRQTRERVFRQAAWLGADLLCAEEVV